MPDFGSSVGAAGDWLLVKFEGMIGVVFGGSFHVL